MNQALYCLVRHPLQAVYGLWWGRKVIRAKKLSPIMGLGEPGDSLTKRALSRFEAIWQQCCQIKIREGWK